MACLLEATITCIRYHSNKILNLTGYSLYFPEPLYPSLQCQIIVKGETIPSINQLLF